MTQNEPLTYDLANELANKTIENKNIEPTSSMPLPPPLIGADKFSKFMFDKIVEGMKMASETIKLDDITLEETYPYNEKIVGENPLQTATPTITISKSDANSVESRPVETVSPAQHTDGFGNFLYDKILTAMKDASVSAQASLDAKQTAEQAAKDKVNKQLATTESTAQGLSNVIMDSIMKGFNPEPVSQGDSEVKEVTTKGSIYELLFGKPVTPETLTYGIGIIDSKLDQPERVRYYFLYRQPATQSRIFGNKEPFIFRVDMEQQSFKNINDVFVGKLKTNKTKEDLLTKKYIIPNTPNTPTTPTTSE